MTTLHKELQVVGLGKNEALVYEALISHAPCKAGLLITKLDIHRNLIYQSLEKLIHKGFVTKVKVRGVWTFHITDPQALLSAFRRQESVLSTIIEQFEIKQQTENANYEFNLNEKRKLEEFIGTNKQRLYRVSSEKFDKTKHEGRMGFNTKRSWSEAGLGHKIKATHSKLEQLGDIERPEKDPVLDVRFSADIPKSKIVLRVEDVSKSFDQKSVLTGFNLEIRGPKRVLIAGANGSGKSTLLSLVAGRSEPDSGMVLIGENLSLGYFSQDVYGLDLKKTAIEELSDLEKDVARCYVLCIKAGLSKQSADKKMEDLSRGQQAKVGFIKLMLAQPDVLVLDEPTNHLDIQTKEAIEKALEGFGGAIILASHDKYFVDHVGVTQKILMGV
jgi:ATP-binding cassette subfamily F protein 3